MKAARARYLFPFVCHILRNGVATAIARRDPTGADALLECASHLEAYYELCDQNPRHLDELALRKLSDVCRQCVGQWLRGGFHTIVKHHMVDPKITYQQFTGCLNVNRPHKVRIAECGPPTSSHFLEAACGCVWVWGRTVRTGAAHGDQRKGDRESSLESQLP